MGVRYVKADDETGTPYDLLVGVLHEGMICDIYEVDRSGHN